MHLVIHLAKVAINCLRGAVQNALRIRYSSKRKVFVLSLHVQLELSKNLLLNADYVQTVVILVRIRLQVLAQSVLMSILFIQIPKFAITHASLGTT